MDFFAVNFVVDMAQRSALLFGYINGTHPCYILQLKNIIPEKKMLQLNLMCFNCQL